MNADRFRFRVWSKEYNMYLKDRMHPVGHSNFYISQEGEIVEDDGPVDEWDNEHPNKTNNPDYTIEQCTGIKDRNGKLIYESDIVQTVTGIQGSVVWSDYFACFRVYINNGFPVTVCDTQEIIGNVREERK